MNAIKVVVAPILFLHVFHTYHGILSVCLTSKEIQGNITGFVSYFIEKMDVPVRGRQIVMASPTFINLNKIVRELPI